MKRLYKALAILLAAVMLFGIAPLTAFAQNGPMTTPVDFGSGATYLAWITGYEPDAEGNYFTDYGMLAGPEYTFYKDLQVHNDAYPGISYDLASNTLTLNNANAPKLVITTNVMGDDFKIKLIGTNALARIVVWGDAYGGNLTFTGNGTLTVNENSSLATALDIHAEGTPGKVTFGKDVSVHLYGFGGVAQSNESTLKNAADVFVCENGQKIEEVSSEPVTYSDTEQINGIYLYNAEANYSGGRRVTSKSDPEGIYTVTNGYRDDPSNELYWVSKYVYLAKYDTYVQDYNAFEGNARENYGQLEYTAAEWAAQNEYTTVTVPSEDPAWVQFRKEEDKDEAGNWTWSEKQLRNAEDPNGIYAYSEGQTLVDDNWIDYYEIHRFYYDNTRGFYIRDNDYCVKLSPQELAQNGWSAVNGVDYVELEYKGSCNTTWGSVYQDAKGNKYTYLWGEGAYSFKEGEGITLSNGFYYYLTKEDSVEYESLSICEKTITKPDVMNHIFYAKEFHYGSVAAHQHSYTKQLVKPTSTALGYTLYSCTCGDSYKSDFTAPTGKLKLKCKTRTAGAQTLTWNNVKTASGYQVQISTKDGKKWNKTATLKAGVTSYTFKSLAAGNAYKFRVRFYVKGEDGKNHFSPWSATLTSPTLPTGTSITKTAGASKAFTAQWKKNAAVNGYQIQYSLKSNFSGAKTVTVKSNKTLKTTVKKLSAKKVYYVRIRTYKTIAKANYYSAWSKTVKVKTK